MSPLSLVGRYYRMSPLSSSSGSSGVAIYLPLKQCGYRVGTGLGIYCG